MPNYVQLKYMPERHMSTAQAEAYFGVTFCACPFCYYPFPGLYMGYRVQVICPNCCAEGPASDVLGFEGARNAVTLWNNRSPPNPIKRL